MNAKIPDVASLAVLATTERFSVERRRFLFDGQRPVVRDIIVHPGSVAILGLVGPTHVALIHNYRYAIGAELLELPAGTLEPPESPEACALRELEEETGYRAGHVELMGRFYPSPGICSELMYIFLATNLQRAGQRLAPGERIRTEVLDLDEIVDRIAGNRIQDAKTIAAVLMCKLRKERDL
jgi:ADP-ribose pyrophosphatase